MSNFFLWVVFFLIIAFALAVSLVCGVVRHTSSSEIDALKKRFPRMAEIYEIACDSRANFVSALGVLYVISAGLGAAFAGVLAGWNLRIFREEIGELPWWIWPAVPLGVLFAALFATCLTGLFPQKLGGRTRRFWQTRLAGLTWFLFKMTLPLRKIVSCLDMFAPLPNAENGTSDDEIRELAQRNFREGKLTREESTLVANAVQLNDISVRKIMTPRNVITAIDATLNVGGVFREFPNLPHGRMPIYEGTLDNISGVVRRRDLLKAKADDKERMPVRALAGKAHFVPENAAVSVALRDLVGNHQYIAVVVDEFGNVSGVITLENIFEYLIGAEISEKDDVAVNMRAFALERVNGGKMTPPQNGTAEK